MTLPALEDIAAHHNHQIGGGGTDPIPGGLMRIETSPREKATPVLMEMIHAVYPHDEVFGEFCTVNDYIDCRPTHSSTIWRTPGPWRNGPTVCGGDSPAPRRTASGWPTTGWVPKPRSTPARWPTGMPAPWTTTAPGIRASTCG